MWWPLAIAVTLIGSGAALLVAGRTAGRKPLETTEMFPMPLPSSTALMTPSRLAMAEAAPEPEEAEPLSSAPAPEEDAPEEPKLSAKQRERLDRLMAAVKSEFQNLLDEEKRKSQG